MLRGLQVYSESHQRFSAQGHNTLQSLLHPPAGNGEISIAEGMQHRQFMAVVGQSARFGAGGSQKTSTGVIAFVDGAVIFLKMCKSHFIYKNTETNF